jgi:probable rRNA maturation factor
MTAMTSPAETDTAAAGLADEDLTAGPPSLSASVRVVDARWLAIAPVDLAGRVLTAVAASGAAPPEPASCDILFADDETLAGLNRRFRGKEGSTNVLSFPSDDPPSPGEARFLGGIALAFGRAEREAEERGIPFGHHATHLTLHGLLHLLGHDHEADDERAEMERIEIELLGGLGIPNPYEGS